MKFVVPTMVYFSSKALITCIHASALLSGISSLPGSLAQQENHEVAEKLIDLNLSRPENSAQAVFTSKDDIVIPRSLADDLNITHHDDAIGQDRFHLTNDFTGSFPKENDPSTADLRDLSFGRRVALSKDGSTSAVAGVLLNVSTEKFRWIVKIFKKDSETGEWDTSNPVEVIEEEIDASIYESDAYVEIALNGDGSALYVTNAKAKRFDNVDQPLAKAYKYGAANSYTTRSYVGTLPTPGVSIGIGYYFAGLQVDTVESGDFAVLGFPYKGEVHVWNPLIPLFSLEAIAFPTASTNSLLGRSVAISKDGTTIVASAPGDNKIYIARKITLFDPLTLTESQSWDFDEILGSDLGISDESGDLGSSLAINQDGNIIAIGSKNHDADLAIDNGSVTVMIKSGNEWVQLGQTLTGERGEGISNGYYYVGDQFGESIAISNKNAYNGTGPSNTIKVVIGAPKNDPDGISGPDYYNGHVEVYEINPDEENAQFVQVAYDIDGGSSGEKSGTSVAIDSEGKTILIGSPGFEASSVGGYFEGVAKMYEQTEYSAFPSVVPSSVPSVTMVPSSVPSTTVEPSVRPSESTFPSLSPSESSAPSLNPSTTVAPSSLPSLSVEPSQAPSTTTQPSSRPSYESSFAPSSSSAPSSSPSVSSLPSLAPSVTSAPSVSMSPSSTPSISDIPSASPTLSSSPSISPTVSYHPTYEETPAPSSNPSLSSAPSVSISPSSVPSASNMPSALPSVLPSVAPTLTTSPSDSPTVSFSPSISLQPSSAPTLSAAPSVSPTSTPSAISEREFNIISNFGPFGKDTDKSWCLTAFDNVQGSKLNVRPCRSYDERKQNLQLWKFNSAGKLSLAGMAEGEFCVKATFRQLALDSCGDTNDASLVDFGFENGSITHTKNGKVWRIGFDPESRFERVRLYRDGTLNDVLNKWDILYSNEFPSAAPSVSMSPTISSQPTFASFNVAHRSQGAVARQSSTGGGFGPHKAIDGNLATTWNKGSTATYKTDKNPWWQVTFSQDYEITLIKIYYMINTGGNLLDSTLTIIRDDQSVYQHVTTAADLSSNPIVLTIPEVVGSTFKIQGAFNKGALRLTEVEVTGRNF